MSYESNTTKGEPPRPFAPLDIARRENEPFGVDANLISTGRSCVIGSSGSGKSYAVGVICEELCKGAVPFAIVDTEGEYYGLKEKYQMIWVGDDQNCDLAWEGLDMAELAKEAPEIAPLILDLSDVIDPKSKIAEFLTALYDYISGHRTPYLIIVEEADRFIPQSGERLQIVNEIARRGRKRGIGLMICTQRPSLVDKNVLSQCTNQIIGRLVIQNDLQAVSQFFPGGRLPRQLTTLRPGEFYAMGGFAAAPVQVTIRERNTRHGGSTPLLTQRLVKPFMGTLKNRGAVPSGIGAYAGGGKTKNLRGLRPLIEQEEVPSIVSRERAFHIFGRKEAVVAVNLAFKQMIELGVRLRTGVIRKKFETCFLLIEGHTGKFAHPGEKRFLEEGLSKLVGLKSSQVELLRYLEPDHDSSAVDLASKLGQTSASTRNLLTSLEKKHLVRAVQVGRSKLFRRIIDLPKPPSRQTPLTLDELEREGRTASSSTLAEEQLRDVVKGLWDGSDLESFTPFLYPVYRVEFAQGRSRREVTIDGRTGTTLDF